ncbi:hypothetical protein [Streptomyces sp. JW3]|uniref:hypothetical protein n=1 Tax=Streptomyces sp. JW3 TaxID=3456955 RepID=UPI003FA46B13
MSDESRTASAQGGQFTDGVRVVDGLREVLGKLAEAPARAGRVVELLVGDPSQRVQVAVRART